MQAVSSNAWVWTGSMASPGPKLPRAALRRQSRRFSPPRGVSVSASRPASRGEPKTVPKRLEACCDFLGRAYASMDERRLEEACLLKFSRTGGRRGESQIAAVRASSSLRTFSATMGRRVGAELPPDCSRCSRTARVRGTRASRGCPPVERRESLTCAKVARNGRHRARLRTPSHRWGPPGYQQWLPGMFCSWARNLRAPTLRPFRL